MKGFVRFFALTCFSSCVVNLHASTFTGTNPGSWSTPATWTITGPIDADGIPDNNDDIIINTNITITLTATNNICHSFTMSNGTFAQNNKVIRFYGDVIKTAGTISGNGTFQFYANPGIIAGVFTNSGNWYFTTGSSTTITAGSVIQKNNNFIINGNATVNNLGTVRFTGGSLNFSALNSIWINGVNSILQVSDDFVGSGTLTCSASPNTVIYNTVSVSSIRRVTYHHLTIQNSGTTVPTWTGGTLTVNGNLTLISTTLNCANQDIHISGNWTNTANTNCQNMAIVSFTGSGTQLITRSGTERFNFLELNGTGTVRLAANINCLGSISINSGTLDVSASNFSITLQGDFIDSGTFNARNGTVTFNGAVPQTIDGVTSTTFYNITSSNAAGVTINFTKQLLNLLTVSAGAFGPSAFGEILLRATGPTTYARIAPVGGSLTGTGWRIEAYVNGPATAYWQYCSTPVNGNSLNDWDNDPRFYCSGTGGNDGNACCPTFFSVRTYNTATNTYSNITSINHILVRGRGYMVWMADNLNSLTAPLVYDSRGTPNFGNVTRAITAGGAGAGYNLVGNPYACPIDYATVVTASGNIGASFMVLQENGTYATNPNGGVIAPNQGFMCVASSTGSMTFTEACKNIVTVPNILRQPLLENYVRINVTNDVNGLGGETAIQLNNDAHNGYDQNYDMPFLASPYELASNIWSTDAENKDNILNSLDANAAELHIPVTVQSALPGNQTISFRGINGITVYNCAWLEDTETGARINLHQQDTYTFFASEAGQKHNFILHFDRSGNDCPLAEQDILPSLDAMTQVYTNDNQVLVKFFYTEKTEVTLSVFDVEGREVSAAQNFTVTGESVSLGNPGAHGVYLVRIQQAGQTITKKIYF